MYLLPQYLVAVDPGRLQLPARRPKNSRPPSVLVSSTGADIDNSLPTYQSDIQPPSNDTDDRSRHS